MHYTFDQLIERRGTRCNKWDALTEKFGREDVVSMWIADMDFECPAPIVAAVAKRAAHPVYGYVQEVSPYASSIKSWVKRRHGWNADPYHFTFVPGVVPGLSVAVQEFSQPGDYILVQRPVYYPFTNTILNNGRKVLNSPLLLKDDHFELDLADFEAKIKEFHPSLFVLCNPHNPVGKVFTPEELRKMGELCAANHVTIVSDEIHSDIMFNGKKHLPMAMVSEPVAQITITLLAPSKTFNIAGMKCSAALIANSDMHARFKKRVEMNGIQGMGVFAPVAFEAAYNECEDYVAPLLAYLKSNIDFLTAFLKEHCPKLLVTPIDATYLPFINCRALNLTEPQLEDFFLNHARIALDYGSWFGPEGEGFVRMNVACPRPLLEQALEQLQTAYHAL